MLQPFRLDEPLAIDEATALLSHYGDRARLYAGGTELLLAMKEGLLHYERLVNIKGIAELAHLTFDQTHLRIGAITTHRTLERSALLREHFPALAAMEAHVANVRVREVGTLGGNLCFAEPHSDPGALLQVHNASVELARPGERRSMPLEAFYVGPFEVALAEDEILTAVCVPQLPPGTAAAYRKFGYLERPSVGVAVAVTATPAGVQDVRVAVGCVGPTPRRLREVEAVLSGKDITEVRAQLATAADMAARACDAVTDLHGAADYKSYMVGVLLRHTFEQAYQQALARGHDHA